MSALLQRWGAWDVRASAWLVRIAQVQRPSPRRWAALTVAHLGDSWVALGVSALLWLWGYPWHSLQLVVTVLALSLVSSLVKALVRRPRPQTNGQALYLGPDRHAFPSGHAVRLGGIVALASGALPVWGVALLASVALLICLCRVALAVHYLGDVTVGLMLGWIVTSLLWSL